MAQDKYLIDEEYHVLQRWTVFPTDPDALPTGALIAGLCDGTYTLNATAFIIQERSSGKTVARIALHMEARSDVSYHTD